MDNFFLVTFIIIIFASLDHAYHEYYEYHAEIKTKYTKLMSDQQKFIKYFYNVSKIKFDSLYVSYLFLRLSLMKNSHGKTVFISFIFILRHKNKTTSIELNQFVASEFDSLFVSYLFLKLTLMKKDHKNTVFINSLYYVRKTLLPA